MKTHELVQALLSNPTTHKVTYGVFARDQLPRHLRKQRPVAIIVNTHQKTKRGEHWVAFYFHKNGQTMYFDSYGLPPSYPEFVSFLKNNAVSYTYNTRRVQGNKRTCGHYCLYFIMSMVRKQPQKMFRHLNINNPTDNDKWIQDWYKYTFPKRLPISNKRWISRWFENIYPTVL